MSIENSERIGEKELKALLKEGQKQKPEMIKEALIRSRMASGEGNPVHDYFIGLDINDLVEIFGKNQDLFTEAVAATYIIPEKEREVELKKLREVAKICHLKFPTTEEIKLIQENLVVEIEDDTNKQ